MRNSVRKSSIVCLNHESHAGFGGVCDPTHNSGHSFPRTKPRRHGDQLGDTM
jgi:hypothetical protein